MIKINLSGFKYTLPSEEIVRNAKEYLKYLFSDNHKVEEMVGWVDIPRQFSKELSESIRSRAKRLSSISDVVVVVGIGGSYMGARAAIEAMQSSFEYLRSERKGPYVIFAGHNLCEDYYSELLDSLEGYSISTIVISKSGSTIEPMVAFRIIRNEIERRYGKDGAKDRIIVITDTNRGVLREISLREGYDMMHISSDVGGRYSVLSSVGLLPMAVAGIDIDEIIEGANEIKRLVESEVPVDENPVLLYSLARYAAYENGLKVEVLANYNPKLTYMSEWWKQLFAESEGKNGRGIFPASANFTTDLHSLGQYIQDGVKMLFETVISVDETSLRLTIPLSVNGDMGGLDFLAGKRVSEINKIAERGTFIAHSLDGGVSNIIIRIPNISPKTIGGLFYFFELSCAISATLLGVNPFDQPGVEVYKKRINDILKAR